MFVSLCLRIYRGDFRCCQYVLTSIQSIYLLSIYVMLILVASLIC